MTLDLGGAVDRHTSQLLNAFGKPASKLQICFAAPIKFPAKDGPAQPFDYDGDPANGGGAGVLGDGDLGGGGSEGREQEGERRASTVSTPRGGRSRRRRSRRPTT
jgi:hypothetical protein